MSTPADPLADLNEAQRSAVLHGDDGDTRPLLIVAGAGSGKTNTLAHRVVHLIRQGVDPSRILLLTFTRRAAQEMERRAETVLAQSARSGGVILSSCQLPWSGTFHAIGARLLREYAGRIGLDESFTIHDRGDAEDLMGLVRHELGLDSTEQRFPKKGTCLGIYSRAVNGQEPLDEVLSHWFPWCAQWEAELKRLFAAYVEAKEEQNALDYDDLLLYWAEMMGDAGIASEIGNRFDHVLIDEYQDTNKLQAKILLAMKPDGKASRSSVTTPSPSMPSAAPPSATSWTSRTSSARTRGSSPWSATTARPRASWLFRMPSSPKRRSVTPSNSGPRSPPPEDRNWCWSRMRPVRPGSWLMKFWPSGRPASP